MTEKKGPVVIGGIDTSKDPIAGAAKRYGAGVAERAAKARAEKPKIGNLAQADAAYKPGRDGPRTIGQITDSLRHAESEEKGGLSRATIDGMTAIARAAEASRNAKVAEPPKEKKMEEMEAQPEPEKRAPTPAQVKEKERVAEALDTMDDFELERIMRGIQNDVINNKAEQEHVNNPENKRITEIDFSAGIAEGEFTQIVDVIPGKLKVHYRTMTPMESQAMRLWIFHKVAEDPRLDKISGEMYGLAQVVATVTQIGTKKFPDHLERQGQGTYSAKFNDQAFAEKYDMFARMPMQMIHAVGTHAQWFDIRVRQLFTTDHAKNG
jgi:hypothetical protein